MPTTYSFRENTSRVACSNCGNSRTFAGHHASAEAMDITANLATLVSDFIRFLPARGRFHSWCRECERAAAAARPNRNGWGHQPEPEPYVAQAVKDLQRSGYDYATAYEMVYGWEPDEEPDDYLATTYASPQGHGIERLLQLEDGSYSWEDD